MIRFIRSRTTAVLVGAGALTLCATTGAVAGGMITSKNIMNHSIQAQDMANGAATSRVIADGGVHSKDLSHGLRAQFKHGEHGSNGDSRTTYVTNLHGLFQARSGDEAGVGMTGDGVQFGPFADGGGCSTPGTDFARLDFSGMNGKKLSAINQLDYTGWYVADNDTHGVGAPVVRVFFAGQGSDGTPNHLTFSPNTQFNESFNYDDSQGAVHTWLVTHGTVRYNDDAGNDSTGEKPWSEWASVFSNAKITNINILNGCQNGINLTSVIRSMQVNGHTYVLGG